MKSVCFVNETGGAFVPGRIPSGSLPEDVCNTLDRACCLLVGRLLLSLCSSSCLYALSST